MHPILQIIINILISIFIILSFHYGYQYIFEKRPSNSTPPTQPQTEKYNKLVDEIKQAEASAPPSIAVAPFKDAIDKEKMNNDLLAFLDSEFSPKKELINEVINEPKIEIQI